MQECERGFLCSLGRICSVNGVKGSICCWASDWMEKRKWLFDGKGDIGMHVCTYMNCEENMFKKETGNCILV